MPETEFMMESNKSLPPGTVRLIDNDRTLSTKHGNGSEQDIVLVPTPSEDPEDPLYDIFFPPPPKRHSTIRMI